MFQNIGEMLVLFWRTLAALPVAWRQRQKVLDQFFEIGDVAFGIFEFALAAPLLDGRLPSLARLLRGFG